MVEVIINNHSKDCTHREEFSEVPTAGSILELYGCRFVVEGVEEVYRKENASTDATVQKFYEIDVRYC